MSSGNIEYAVAYKELDFYEIDPKKVESPRAVGMNWTCERYRNNWSYVIDHNWL